MYREPSESLMQVYRYMLILFVCRSVFLPVLQAFISVCMPVHPSVCLSTFLSDYLPLQPDQVVVVSGFNATLTAKVISWRSVTHMFLGFLTLALTLLFFPNPPTTFLTCICRGERRKYAGKKSRLNRGSNSYSAPGHESDTLTTEPPGRGIGR